MLQRRLQAQRARVEQERQRVQQDFQGRRLDWYKQRDQKRLDEAAKRAFVGLLAKQGKSWQTQPGFGGAGWGSACQPGTACRPGQVRQTATGWYVTNGTQWAPFTFARSRPGPHPQGARRTWEERKALRKATPLWYRLFGGRR